MGEKTRLTAMAAVFIALSFFCWGTSVWSAGQSEGLACQPDGAFTVQQAAEMTAESSDDENMSVDAEAAAGNTGADIRAELTNAQALALGRALAAAGTPFFDDPAQLSAPQLEEAVIWYLMETGGMPPTSGGQVALPAAEVWQLAGELFGALPGQPEDCALAVYDREQDAFCMTAGVCIPVYDALEETVREEGNQRFYRMQLYPPDGWEGDVLGNAYRPDMTAAAVVALMEGRFAGWMGG